MISIETTFAQNDQPRYLVPMIVLTAILFLGPGCSIKDYTTRAMAEALSESGTVYASDEDIELIGEATPFALKTMEMVLADQPEHHRLLVATARAFTQYAYLYVEWPADQLEDRDVAAAYQQRSRARRLYLRARDYGLRALETVSPGVSSRLRRDPETALSDATPAEVPALYWTGVSWGAAIALGKDDPHLLADLPLVEALITRALELDESFDRGSIHVFLIRYEMSRQLMGGDAIARARKHCERAVEISDGKRSAPYVALAESVSVTTQDRSEFEATLGQALDVDPQSVPELKLENLVMQARAHWLLQRADYLFSR